MIYPAPGKHRVLSGISETVELNVANEEGGLEQLRDIVLRERLNDRERINRGSLKVILKYYKNKSRPTVVKHLIAVLAVVQMKVNGGRINCPGESGGARLWWAPTP
jgi:hypothetical protein